jgi:BrnA antitoxin of type II toxin-antitoxin system
LGWLKAGGRGYQTRINRLLRAAMKSTKEPRRETARARKKTRGPSR